MKKKLKQLGTVWNMKLHKIILKTLQFVNVNFDQITLNWFSFLSVLNLKPN